MRTIQISTRLFSKIWSARSDGEEDENSILERLLGVAELPDKVAGGSVSATDASRDSGRIVWRDDVRAGLVAIGSSGTLTAIYDAVRHIRRKAGRSLPRNTDAIIRRELENNSADSKVFKGQYDWFRSVDGIGSGVWALR
eukprot:TRINITY_DN28631_c1_g1_i1.p1 TRINITY_DN28631_c1_g1~~TRINITY_DN28631_c1_g1_i1.p1  ORF type:complete len:140 (+),score=13.80 TRINITY_DN28631_c1_g1_i1:99-518(+)